MGYSGEDATRRTGPALEAMNQFIRWLIPAVEKFPRTQKFLLGDRIQSTALDVLERLIEASYTRDRQKSLQAANLGVEKLRHLFRIGHDLHYIDFKKYEHALADWTRWADSLEAGSGADRGKAKTQNRTI